MAGLRSLFLLWLQLLLDRVGHFRRIRGDGGFEALHHIPVAIYEELREVPLDLAADPFSRLPCQVGIQGGLVRPFDGDLAAQGESHAVLATAERLVCLARARL